MTQLGYSLSPSALLNPTAPTMAQQLFVAGAENECR